MKDYLILVSFIFYSFLSINTFAQNPIFSEVMFAPNGSNNEFIELYNPNGQSIDLSDFQIQYSSSSPDQIESYDNGSTNLLGQAFAVIVEADFDINNSSYSIPASALIVQIDDNAFGTGGMSNSSDRDIFLLNSSDDTVAVYTYSANNNNGISDEKINLNSDNTAQNWANSLITNGTPGSLNSVTPKEVDLAVTSIEIIPFPAIEQVDLTATVNIENFGLQKAASFSVSLYNDINFDSSPQQSELINSFTLNDLASGESLQQNFVLGSFPESDVQLIAVCQIANDENSANDTFIYNFHVFPPSSVSNDIVINEIMYDPSSGEPEWVEIYNRSQNIYSLKDWQFADASNSSTITEDDFQLGPNQYLILVDNADIENFYEIDSEIIVMSLPSLNNGGDKLILYDDISSVVDSLTYDNTWGGGDGYSLERIDPAGFSFDENNWAESESPVKASPGTVNSVSQKQNDLSVSEINFIPDPTIVGDEISVDVKVKNEGTSDAGEFLFYIYQDENDDSTGQTNERIYDEVVSGLTAGDSLTFSVNLNNLSIGKYLLIGEIRYNQDEYKYNNRNIAELLVSPEPDPYNSIVINEIMYAPKDEEPEWIELLNRSEQPINLKKWHFSDAADTIIVIEDDLFIQPDSFLVIADNENIFNYYDSLTSKIVFANLPTLNNNGDRILISDSLFFANDSLNYTSSWGGNNGKSLERINPDEPSDTSSNWSTSTNPEGATPGKANSVLPRDNDLALLDFQQKSDFVFINLPAQFSLTLSNSGSIDINNAQIDIYLDSNRDSSFTEDELIENINSVDVSSRSEKSILFDHTFSSEGEIYLLAVGKYQLDNYPLNDSVQLSTTVIDPEVSKNEIVINEFLYSPVSSYPEWIELYNTSPNDYTLSGFSIADMQDTSVITKDSITLGSGSFIVISKDSLISELYNIPSNVIVTSFPSLNNSSDKIMLLDNYNRVIDSLVYFSAWGGDSGRSLEKINALADANLQSNWTTSIDTSKGTPGRINSVSPKDYNVSLINFFTEPANPNEGDEVLFFAKVINSGKKQASFSIKLYESNSDSIKENLLDEINIQNLNSGGEETINFNYKIDSFTGEKFFIASADFPLDQDTTDNKKLIFITALEQPTELVINEIMFNPDGDEPEWIEFYNNSNSTINIKNWLVSDVLSNPAKDILTQENVFIEPGNYLSIAKDENIFDYYDYLETNVLIVPFANLNNTVDGVVVYDSSGAVIDSVFYNDKFETESGYSIERISASGLSNDPKNWGVSTARYKGTPGLINSLVPKNYDLLVDEITIDPKFPQFDESITIAALISNNGSNNAEAFNVTFKINELNITETIPIQNLSSDTSKMVSMPSSYQMRDSIVVNVNIEYSPDEFIPNNTLVDTFYSGLTKSSVLINEVMYDPLDNQSEWIEFVNVSGKTINLKNWGIAEKSTLDNPEIIIKENFTVEPDEYFVVAKDTSTEEFDNFKGNLLEAKFGELNSTEDDIVLYDFRNAVIDSLKYFSDWGGGNGFSIERISLDQQTNERTNWLPSIFQNGSTPGTENSIAGFANPEENEIVINEIMFEPDSNNSEFIEFYNKSDQFVEVANWLIEDEAKNESPISNTSLSIPPDSYFLVAADSSILLTYPELNNFDKLIIINRDLSLNNSEDLIILYDAFGETIDSVFYNSDWHNKNILTTSNKSLERINPEIRSSDKNNWSTSTASAGATPGEENSIFVKSEDSESKVSINPNPFSPDGDGFEDFTIINYKLPQEISSIQIKVFDSQGRKVRSIAENNLWGNEGSIIFDGFNDDGQPLKIGIYILLIEVSDGSGYSESFKDIVVVARKL